MQDQSYRYPGAEEKDRPKTPTITVQVTRGEQSGEAALFNGAFVVGRGKECEFRIQNSVVSRRHVRIYYDNGAWRFEDLGSSNGTYLNGNRTEAASLSGPLELELGQGGPVLALTPEPEPARRSAPSPVPREFTTETQIIRHYLDKSRTEKPGEQTMMFRRAIERVQKKKSRAYWVIIGVALVLLALSGAFIVHQKNEIAVLTKTAEEIFYLMKSQELQIGKLEDLILLQAKPKQLAELKAKRGALREMEKEYDKLVMKLGIYRTMSEEDRIIIRTARSLGECEINAPREFIREVRNYIKKWKSSDRFAMSLNRVRTKGYAPIVEEVMARYELPSHYFFLALQESGFQEEAVGPKTRYGYAKGIWQMIPNTAKQYGLHIGPLFEEPVYDRKDDRFNFEKATRAAAAYLRDISNTEAQASGLLVMASYNWGENNTRRIIRQMPQNPRERNFWRLLATGTIPRETYDYVYSIVSAAAICENPRLFGFDFVCPLTAPQRQWER